MTSSSSLAGYKTCRQLRRQSFHMVKNWIKPCWIWRQADVAKEGLASTATYCPHPGDFPCTEFTVREAHGFKNWWIFKDYLKEGRGGGMKMSQHWPFSWIRPDKFPVGGQVRVKPGSIYPENVQSTKIFVCSCIFSHCLILEGGRPNILNVQTNPIETIGNFF